MKKNYSLLAAHLVFWMLLFGFMFAHLGLALYGKPIPAETLLAVLFLPFLEIQSWSAFRAMPASPFRRYLTSFLIVGPMFWIYNAFLLWTIFLKARTG
jgi:hypothetical protein